MMMKKRKMLWPMVAAMMLWGVCAQAQNPNWTMPPNKFEPGNTGYNPLPPEIPGGPGYNGAAATNLHAEYSDNNGNLLFFKVDEKVYSVTNGESMWAFDIKDNLSRPKRGFNERLFLPMGNSCTRFAILTVGGYDYVGSKESWSTNARIRLYMSIYNAEEKTLEELKKKLPAARIHTLETGHAMLTPAVARKVVEEGLVRLPTG